MTALERRSLTSCTLPYRVASLTEKLKDRLRPIVEAKRPGESSDPDTAAFEKKIKAEAEELKFESFGVEVT